MYANRNQQEARTKRKANLAKVVSIQNVILIEVSLGSCKVLQKNVSGQPYPKNFLRFFIPSGLTHRKRCVLEDCNHAHARAVLLHR